jgi:hypothetical protein
LFKFIGYKKHYRQQYIGKRRADLILSTSVAHPSFVLLSTVVLQIPPFANIFPLRKIGCARMTVALPKIALVYIYGLLNPHIRLLVLCFYAQR